jgi:citrate synthase
VATAVSSHGDGELYYRAVPLADLVRDAGFASAAALVLGCSPHELEEPQPGTSSLGPAIRALPIERRLPVAMQLLAASNPLAVDVQPARVRRTAVRSVVAAVAAFDREDSSAGRGDDLDELPALLLRGLRAGPAPSADTDLVKVLLIALLDHGLTASTVAARVAASTRAGVHDCLCAAYAAMAGPLHGAAPIAARALLDDPGSAPDAVAEALRRHGHIPGFGHFRYPAGDPRAELVLDTVWRRRGTSRLRLRVEALADVVSRHSGARPNIDLASAAALSALRLPAAAGAVVFQVARSFGVTAHVIEEYTETPLRWRGQEADG